MNRTINTAYIGSSDFSVIPLKRLAKESFIRLKCVITLSDRISGRNNKRIPTPVKVETQRLGHDIIEADDLRDERLISRLKELDLDFIVVCSYSKMIPGRLLKLPKFFCINIHPSLLPEYRGAAPINRVLMEGRTQTGVSFFRMNKKLDSGKIIFQKKMHIDPDDDYISLSQKLSLISGEYIPDVILNIHESNYTLKSQEDELSTYAFPISKSECRISWEDKSVDIHNKIRGLTGYLPAYTVFNKKRLQILKSELSDCNFPEEAEPGTVIIKERDVIVKCGQGTALLIKQVKPEGKNAMKAFDFAQGYNIASEKALFE